MHARIIHKATRPSMSSFINTPKLPSAKQRPATPHHEYKRDENAKLRIEEIQCKPRHLVSSLKHVHVTIIIIPLR
jgi:hypothetical protein